MKKHKPNDARPGQVVYRLGCCDGPRLVKEGPASSWSCGRCGGQGRMLGKFVFDKQMNLVAVTTKKASSYT